MAAPGQRFSRLAGPAVAVAAMLLGPTAGLAQTATAVDNPDMTALRQSLPPDGDLSPPPPEAESLDGLAQPAEDAPLDDGLDPLTSDVRPASERDAFAYPDNPSGTLDASGDGAGDDNPLLFQIEEIEPFDPALNRRPAQFASLDPYDPIGIRIGTFVLFPESEMSVVRYSNVFASPDGEADAAFESAPRLRFVSDWSNHALEFEAAGDLSNHREFGGENDRGYSLRARGRLDVTRRTNLQAALGRASSQESRSAIDAATAGPRATVRSDTFDAALNHRFNRLSISLRGGVSDDTFSDSGSGAAALADRDVLERTGAVRATWEFKPTFQVFGEAEGIDREFAAASTADGLLRNSQGVRLRAGVSFGQTSDILRGEASLGYGRQDLAAPDLVDADGLIVDANLAWRITGLTSLLFTASSDIRSVTQTAGSGAVLERRGGIEARHAFRRHLIGSATIAGTRRDYAGIDIDETEFAFGLGLDYYLRREAVLFSRYEHTIFRSDFAGSNYESDEIRIGLRIRR